MINRLHSIRLRAAQELAAVGLIICLVVGCGSTYQSVGICQGLQTNIINDRLVAICWSDETSVATAVGHQELLGTSYSNVNELLDAFAEERTTLEARGTGNARTISGFVYQLSHPQTVNDRKQYNLEITLPSPIDSGAVAGPTKDVIDFVKQKNGSSHKVDLSLVPVSDGRVGTVSLHIEDWKIRSITVEQYVAK
jgi:hypothetical protein